MKGWALAALLLSSCQSQSTSSLPEVTPGHLVATNVRIDIRVDDMQEAISDIVLCIQLMEGYTAEENILGNGSEVVLDLRLPTHSYPEALQQCIRPSGDVISTNIWSQDITSQYTELHDQLKQLEATTSDAPWYLSWEAKRQIQFVQSKMAYRLERAAFATIVIHLKAQSTTQ